jgi:hypothetical protein
MALGHDDGMRNRPGLRWGIWIGALALIGFTAGAVVLNARASRTSTVTASYTQIGSVEGERFWAKRFTQEGTAGVAFLATGAAGTLCNSAGAYETRGPNLICADGTGSWTGFAMPVSRVVRRVEVESQEGQVVSLRVVPPPSGWPLGFAIGLASNGTNDVFTVGRVTCYGEDGTRASC